MSGCAGSSENVARQTRAVSSGHVRLTEFPSRTTPIGPGLTPGEIERHRYRGRGRLQRHENQSGKDGGAH